MANVKKDILVIDNLLVSYGQARAVQGVSLSLGHGVLAVVGRNGMGKTSLCNAVTGMVKASGRISFDGRDILGLAPNLITNMGIAYVPQGRRVWRSLTVDEHLQLASRTARKGEWNIERVYQVFPRLAERRRNGGAQLSGGEQQMLAIARALLFNPLLLVMDEPTEGLAPVIVDHVVGLIKQLAYESNIPVLLIEQNLGVALAVSEKVAVMVNGQVATIVSSEVLKNDRQLQEQLLGVQSGGRDAGHAVAEAAPAPVAAATASVEVFRLVRAHKGPSEPAGAPAPSPAALPQTGGGGHAHDGEIFVVGDSQLFGAEMAHLRGSMLRDLYRVRTVDITMGTQPSMADIRPVELESRAGALPRGDIRSKAAAIHAGLASLLNHGIRLRAVIVLADASQAAAMHGLLAGLPERIGAILLSPPGALQAAGRHTALCLFDYGVQGAGAIDRSRLDLAAGALGGMLASLAARNARQPITSTEEIEE
jgi:ABC-type branched-subunit amino acid transport system ATPase component